MQRGKKEQELNNIDIQRYTQNETDALLQQRMARVLKEPRNHIYLESQCRVDAISKNELSNSKERTWRFCRVIHEAQKG